MAEAALALQDECFFIAPIGEEGGDIRRRSDGVLRFIVGRAAEELSLTAVRADQIAAPGQITLQVIDHILGARAAVADLTDRNPNVFYELAVRHTARLPVALIVARDDPPLPFDIAQMRTIRFDHTDLESADQCRQGIVAHLREALAGAVDSPVATSVDLRVLQGGNQVERNVAELITSVEDLARAQSATARTVDRLLGELLDRQVLTPDVAEFIVETFFELDAMSDKLRSRNELELAGIVQRQVQRLNEIDMRFQRRRSPRFVARGAELVEETDSRARDAAMTEREKDRPEPIRRRKQRAAKSESRPNGEHDSHPPADSSGQ
jgi:hypothetical protein